MARHKRRRSFKGCTTLGCAMGSFTTKRNVRYLKWGAAALAAWWLYRKTKAAADAAAANASQMLQNSANQADAVNGYW